MSANPKLEVAPGVYVHGTREAISILQARLAPPVPAALDALLRDVKREIDECEFTADHLSESPERMALEGRIGGLRWAFEAALRAAGPRPDQKQVTLGVDWGRGESWTVGAAGPRRTDDA